MVILYHLRAICKDKRKIYAELGEKSENAISFERRNDINNTSRMIDVYRKVWKIFAFCNKIFLYHLK